MSYIFFKNKLREKTDELSIEKSALFSIFNCSRIIHLYELVQIQYGVGDYDSVKEMSNFIWDKILDINTQQDNMKLKFDNIQELVPDSEKYHGINNTLALNVVICLDIAYKCILSKSKISHLSSLYVYDTIKQIILSKSLNIKYITSEIDLKIDDFYIIKNEIEYSNKILNLISKSQLDKELICYLRKKAISEKYKINDIPSFNLG